MPRMIYKPKAALIQLPSLWLPDSRRQKYAYPSSSRGLARRCCCDVVPFPCSECSGQTPLELRVVIAGITNAACEDCVEDINGEFIARHEFHPDADWGQVPIVSLNPCGWYYEYEGTPCDIEWLHVAFDGSSTLSVWVIEFDTTNYTVGFNFSVDGDCDSWNGVVVPLDFAPGASFQCNPFGATATVTAL